jgi:hypothetical protein
LGAVEEGGEIGIGVADLIFTEASLEERGEGVGVIRRAAVGFEPSAGWRFAFTHGAHAKIGGRGNPAVITHVRCVNPNCTNYDLWKSVARAEAQARNTKICSLCGGPMKEAKRSEGSGNQGGTREKGS